MTSRHPGFRYAMAGALMFAVAGCAAVPKTVPPPPTPRPVAPAPAPAPIPTPAKSWEDRTVEGGVWRYDAASRTAAFVPTGSASPLVSLACNGGNIRLTSALGAGGTPLDVDLRTSAGTDRLRLEGGSTVFPARDGRLDRIAFSRGRFALEASDGRALTLPVQTEIGRVIEDCRG